jgi:hypothetical protein
MQAGGDLYDCSILFDLLFSCILVCLPTNELSQRNSIIIEVLVVNIIVYHSFVVKRLILELGL